MTPFFSIITPTKNSEVFIKDTAQSVLSQSFTNWEWIVVDDMSSDLTTSIIEDIQRTDSRVSLIRVRNINHPAISRNIGVRQAKGFFICFLDHDDLILTDYLKSLHNILNGTDEIDCIVTNYLLYYSDRNEKSALSLPVGVIENDFLLKKLLNSNRICLSAFSIKLNFLLRIGLINESFEVWGANDYELYLRALKFNGKFYFLDKPLVKYRISNNSMVADRTRNIHNTIVVLDEMLRDQHFIGYHHLISKYKAKCLFQLGVNNLSLGRKDYFLNILVGIYGYHGFSFQLVKWLLILMVPPFFSRRLI
ncbi:MAG: glycosyltransferase [Cyclobacteriaceae bacterium]|nr:glycosyltransferase [Cyclobacteriaceae bacterium]